MDRTETIPERVRRFEMEGGSSEGWTDGCFKSIDNYKENILSAAKYVFCMPCEVSRKLYIQWVMRN